MRGGGGLGMSSAADRGPAYTHLQLASFARSHPTHPRPSPNPFTQTRRLQPEGPRWWCRGAPPPPRSSPGGHLEASIGRALPNHPRHAPAPSPTPRVAPLQRSLEVDQHVHLRRGSPPFAHRRAHDLGAPTSTPSTPSAPLLPRTATLRGLFRGLSISLLLLFAI